MAKSDTEKDKSKEKENAEPESGYKKYRILGGVQSALGAK